LETCVIINQVTAEVTEQAESDWTVLCKEIADMTLFPKAESWIFGANIPGKKNTVMFYLGGLGNYRQVIDEEASNGYQNFVFDKNPTAVNEGFLTKLGRLFGSKA